jgi:hypothetical protein
MSFHVVTKSTLYKVVPGSPVTVRVVIGDAQAGGWIVAWDDQHIVAKGSDPQIVEIGVGAELIGRSLQVNATAVDVNPDTNRLSCTLAIGGGADGAKQIVSTYDDGDAGDSAVFATMIGFE